MGRTAPLKEGLNGRKQIFFYLGQNNVGDLSL